MLSNALVYCSSILCLGTPCLTITITFYVSGPLGCHSEFSGIRIIIWHTWLPLSKCWYLTSTLSEPLKYPLSVSSILFRGKPSLNFLSMLGCWYLFTSTFLMVLPSRILFHFPWNAVLWWDFMSLIIYLSQFTHFHELLAPSSFSLRYFHLAQCEPSLFRGF